MGVLLPRPRGYSPTWTGIAFSAILSFVPMAFTLISRGAGFRHPYEDIAAGLFLEPLRFWAARAYGDTKQRRGSLDQDGLRNWSWPRLSLFLSAPWRQPSPPTSLCPSRRNRGTFSSWWRQCSDVLFPLVISTSPSPVRPYSPLSSCGLALCFFPPVPR